MTNKKILTRFGNKKVLKRIFHQELTKNNIGKMFRLCLGSPISYIVNRVKIIDCQYYQLITRTVLIDSTTCFLYLGTRKMVVEGPHQPAKESTNLFLVGEDIVVVPEWSVEFKGYFKLLEEVNQ